jgi:hypothetical protein
LGGIDDFLSAESMQVWRYGLAGAVGMTIIVSLMWTGLRETSESADMTGQVAGENSSLIMTSRIPSASTLAMAPSQFPGSLHVVPADDQLTLVDLPERLPTVTRTESSTPQYVLDRISVTPASYEVASVHF